MVDELALARIERDREEAARRLARTRDLSAWPERDGSARRRGGSGPPAPRGAEAHARTEAHPSLGITWPRQWSTASPTSRHAAHDAGSPGPSGPGARAHGRLSVVPLSLECHAIRVQRPGSRYGCPRHGRQVSCCRAALGGQGFRSGDEHRSGLEFTALEPTKSPGGVLERELLDDRVD